jgi:hypothetical protein
MKRFAITAAAMAVAGAVAAPAVDASQQRAQLRGLVCQRALDPPARGVAITAPMRPLTATRKMQLRFQLLRKSRPGGSYSPVRGGDLGSWITPANPTLGQRPGDVWIVHKQVVDLAAPASYHFRVSFRWVGAHGRLLGTATRLSGTCYQPELRPDLLVQSIVVQAVAGRPNVNRYVATIRNDGATAAGPFAVQFAPGSSLPVQTRSVAGLAAHGRAQRAFIGPLCSTGSVATVTVDPSNQVADFDRANNSMTAVCSAASGQ